MTTARDVDAALRTIDPTGDDDADARAATDLERILATGTSAPLRQTTTPSPPRPRTVRRVGLAGGVVAAATTGLVVLPSVLGGDSAFATWTAYPTGLSPEEAATATEDCRGLLLGTGPDLRRAADADTAIAERRGRWTQVVLTHPDGFFASCLSGDPWEDNFSAGASDSPRLPGPRGLTLKSFGTATLDAGDVSDLTGRAGGEVATVTYPSQDHGDVVATVDEGVWALWFPGDELENVADPEGIQLRVGYQDGSTATVTLLGECDRGLVEERC